MIVILTLALLGLFALLMLGWPRTGTAVVIAVTMLWPAYITLIGIPGPGVNPQRLMIPAAIMIWMMHMLAAPTYRRQLGAVISHNSGIVVLISASFVLGVVAGALSPFDKSQAIWGSLNQIMFMPMLMLLVVSYFRTKRSIYRLLALFVGIAFVAQVVGACEWLRQEVIFNEFVVPGSEHAGKILEGKLRLEQHRVTSVFDNPLSYAQYLVFVAPLVMFQLREGVRPFWQTLAWIQLLTIPFSVWATGSRTAIALIMLTYLAGIALWLRRLKLSKGLGNFVVSSVIGVVVLASVILVWRTGLNGLLAGSESIEASTIARVDQLALGIPAVAQSPVVGVGVHQGTNFLGGLTSIDNYYLTVVLEKGIVGLLLLLALQLAIVIRLYKAMRKSACKSDTALYRLLMISFVTLFVFELTLSVVEVFSVSLVVLACFLMLDYFEQSSDRT